MHPYKAGIAAHSSKEAIPSCTTPPYNTDKGCDRYPRFTSALSDHGYVRKVEGVEELPPGSYPFTCQVHSQIRVAHRRVGRRVAPPLVHEESDAGVAKGTIDVGSGLTVNAANDVEARISPRRSSSASNTRWG